MKISIKIVFTLNRLSTLQLFYGIRRSFNVLIVNISITKIQFNNDTTTSFYLLKRCQQINNRKVMVRFT